MTNVAAAARVDSLIDFTSDEALLGRGRSNARWNTHAVESSPEGAGPAKVHGAMSAAMSASASCVPSISRQKELQAKIKEAAAKLEKDSELTLMTDYMAESSSPKTKVRLKEDAKQGFQQIEKDEQQLKNLEVELAATSHVLYEEIAELDRTIHTLQMQLSAVAITAQTILSIQSQIVEKEKLRTELTLAWASAEGMLQQREKSKPVAIPAQFRNEVAATADAIQLQRIKRGIEQAAGAKVAPLELAKVDQNSLNPVAKLDIPFFVQKARIAEKQPEISVSIKMAFTACQKAFDRVRREIDSDREMPSLAKGPLQDRLFECLKEYFSSSVKPVFASGNVTTTRDFFLIRRDLDKRKPEQQTTTLEKFQAKLIVEMNREIAIMNLTIELDEVPCRYERDAMISSLQVVLATLAPGDTQTAEKIVALLQVLSKVQEAYIPAALVEYWITQMKDQQTVIKYLLQIKKTLTEYVSSLDVLAFNQGKAKRELLIRMANLDPENVVSFAFKLGEENIKELLAGKVALILALNRYLLIKREETLKGGLLGIASQPTGIASKWVAGEVFPHDIWLNWLKVRHEYVAQTRLSPATAALELKYSQAKRAVLDFDAIASIIEHVVTDTVLGAGDSHLNQYKKGANGQMYNYDFSRFFAPHFAFTKDDETFLVLRSDFFNHPIVFEPMTVASFYADELCAIKAKILAWDVNQIEASMRKDELIGTPESFDEAEKARALMTKDFELLAAKKTTVQEIATKYKVVFVDGETEAQKEIKVKAHLINERDKMRLTCWGKIDPRAIVEWKKRTLAMQTYLRQNSAPTLRGAWEAFYPELSLFVRVLERMEENPGSGLLFRVASQAEMSQERAASNRTRSSSQEAALKPLSIEERKKYKLIKDTAGIFATQNTGMLHTADPENNSHIFVVAPDADFYVGQQQLAVFDHTSFFGSTQVQAAGRLIFKNGKIVGTSDDGGSIKPDAQMVVAGLKALKALGVDLSGVSFTTPQSKGKTIASDKVLDALAAGVARENKPEPQPRSLESIIFHARKKMLATDNELVALSTALREIRRACPTQQRAVLGGPGS